MDTQLQEKIIKMLDSSDPEMWDLAAHLFCQETHKYIELYRIMKKVEWNKSYVRHDRNHIWSKMAKCTIV